MVCPVCHSYSENNTAERWGVFVNNGAETFTIIPCTVRDNLRHIAGGFLNFRAHGRRYVLDVYRGHKTTMMGGNDWVKFIADFNLGAGALVVFDTSKRMAKAYVGHLGCAYVANDGDPGEDIVVDEDEVDQGAGAEGFNIESDEEVLK